MSILSCLFPCCRNRKLSHQEAERAPLLHQEKLSVQIFTSISPRSFTLILSKDGKAVLRGHYFTFKSEAITTTQSNHFSCSSENPLQDGEFNGDLKFVHQADREPPRVLIDGSMTKASSNFLQTHTFSIFTEPPTLSSQKVTKWTFKLQSNPPHNQEVLPGVFADTLEIEYTPQTRTSIFK